MDTANVMQSRVLPAEVCARIVRYAYRGDLPALCRTSKLFQEHAEARLYQEITLQDPRVVSRICGSLLAHEGRRASYLRRFWVSIETRPFLRVPVSEQFWRLISDVLPKADNLELLLAWNPEVCSSLLMDPTSVHFQLRDAIFQLSWDKHLVAFLQTQRKIHSLTISGVDVQADDNGTTRIQPISSDCLPELITYEGPLEVATELLSRPLRHVQAQIMDEDGDVLLTFLAKAARSSKTLRSLNAIVIPEFLVCDVLRILADSPLSEHLRHLGVLALPLSELERCDMHRSLLKFYRLEMLQIDLSHWPGIVPAFQRVVASELRIYCPSLRLIFFWLGHHQMLWRCENEQWNAVQSVERRLAQNTYWRNF